MSGRPAYDRESYREDIAAMRARRMSWAEVASHLGISRATLYRIKGDS